MIAFLSGTIRDTQPDKNHSQDFIITVGSESTGVLGYLVKAPKNPKYEFLNPGQKVELFIYSHIREDAFDLYGFLTLPEKTLFLSLLSINGVGPKMAMGILSQVSEGSLVEMILTEDKEGLTKIPGVGKKTAERIIIELKEKLQKRSAEFLQARTKDVGQGKNNNLSAATGVFIEASLALQALGYKETQAKQMIENVSRGKSFTKVEELIKSALQNGNA